MPTATGCSTSRNSSRGSWRRANAWPDWDTRREVVRALVKKVEIDEQEVRIVYRVSPSPFEGGPQQGSLQHCWGRDRSTSGGNPMSFDSFATPQLDRAAELCERFEDAWRAGHRPRIDDFLNDVGQAERSAMLGL